MLEWLWHSRRKMMATEYVVALLTFLAIGLTNIELGCVCLLATWVRFRPDTILLDTRTTNPTA